MSPLVKVCGNTCTKNISSILESKNPPDYLGFILSDTSPRGISPTDLRDILQHLPLHVKSVLVTVTTSIEDFKSMLMESESTLKRLAAIQLHGDQDREFMLSCKEFFEGCLIKVVPVADKSDFSKCLKFKDIADYFLFDSKGSSGKLGGTGEVFDWGLLKGYDCKIPYFLAGGVSPDDAPRLKKLSVQHPYLHAVDINSRFENSPGIKDPVRVDRFIQEIRS